MVDVGDLYDAQARRPLVFFSRRTYDGPLAMDLVAETFARAYEHRDRYRGDSDGEAAGCLRGIARNVLHETQRRGHPERRVLARLGMDPERLSDVELARVRPSRSGAFFVAYPDRLPRGRRWRVRAALTGRMPIPFTAYRTIVLAPT